MNFLDILSQGLLFLGVAGAVALRFNRNQSATLVLQQFTLDVTPRQVAKPTVEIVGRAQGVVAFFLSLMGFSPVSRFTIAGPEVRYQTTSLFGQRSQFIPLRCVTSMSAGIQKPISYIVWAILFVSGGCYASVSAGSIAPIAIGLAFAIVAVILYFTSKKFFIEIHPHGGPAISLLFKPNVLEGVPIDAEQALEVVGVIRDLIVLQESHPGVSFQSAAQDDDVPEMENLEDHTTDDGEEDSERQALHWYNQARQYSNSGQTRLAIATLQQLIRNFPDTPAAEQARRSLAQTGR